jgi:hypothetical protein
MLWKDAQSFIQTLAKTKVDIDAVESALEKVALGRLHRDQLCRELYRPLGVGVELLRTVGTQEQTQAGRNITFAEVSPWPEEVDGHGLVLDMMDIVHRHIIASDYSSFYGCLVEPIDLLCRLRGDRHAAFPHSGFAGNAMWKNPLSDRGRVVGLSSAFSLQY